MLKQPTCLVCKYYLENFTCKAFPDGIPYEIASERKEHNRIIKGQKGDFVFELEEKC